MNAIKSKEWGPEAAGARSVIHSTTPVLGREPERDDESFVDDWRREVQHAPPFLSADFFLLTAQLIGETPLVVVARDAGASLYLPLYRRGRELFSLCSDQSPRYDLAGNLAALPRLWRVLSTAVDWDALTLRGVPVTSSLVRVLPALARADGCEVTLRRIARAPYLPLAESDRDLDDRIGREPERRAGKLLALRFERITAADPDALEQTFELEASTGRRNPGTTPLPDPHLCQFYRQVARTFARAGRLELAFLRFGERRVAAHFAAEDDRTHYLIKSGHDPAFGDGVGDLLLREAARDARRRGLRRFDLLDRDGPAKRRWRCSALPHVELRIYRPTLRGLVRHAIRERVRPLAARLASSLRRSPRA